MKLRLIPVLMAMSFSVGLFGQVTAPEGDQANAGKFAGVWRGQLDGLPGIDLVIDDEGGQLHGAVLFYFHSRPNVNAPYTSTPGLPEPMFDLRLDGKTLN